MDIYTAVPKKNAIQACERCQIFEEEIFFKNPVKFSGFYMQKQGRGILMEKRSKMDSDLNSSIHSESLLKMYIISIVFTNWLQ